MSVADPSEPRLLFVVDNDFGALGVVMYLLHGQPLAARATVLLPRRAHELHADGLAVASRPYGSMRDILDAAAADRPDVVLLFSGYLLARHDLVAIGELGRLVRGLRRLGCAVATSDPCLGLFPLMAQANVTVRTGALPRALKRWLGRLPWLHDPLWRLADALAGWRRASHVRRVAAAMADVPHVYPAAVAPGEAGGVAPFCFFNPRYLRGAEGRLAEPPGAEPVRPRWLFVLAQYDLFFQEEKHGLSRFADLVAAKIGEAVRQGRRATFVGPAAFVAALASRVPPGDDVELVGRCSFAEFDRRLLDAEAAFYWQIFSTSAFVRLWNGLPVFSFDAGHTAHYSPPLHAAGLRHYFAGHAPRYLDIEQPLDAAAIAASGEGFRESARQAVARLARLPTPRAMADALIGAAPAARTGAGAVRRARQG